MLRMLTTSLVAFVIGLLAPAAFAQNTAFTYQDRLRSAGLPANGSYDIQFELWDAPTGGTLLSSSGDIVAVTGGVFSAQVQFITGFSCANPYLQIKVRPQGVGAYQLLTPRQSITPTPCASGLTYPFVGIADISSDAFTVSNTTGAGIAGINTQSIFPNGAGVVGVSEAASGIGVSGFANSGTLAKAVYGEALEGFGLLGLSQTGTGMYGQSSSGNGAHGFSVSAAGIEGNSSTGPGVYGKNSSSTTTSDAGVVGESTANNGNGVAGFANNGTNAWAVYGQASGGGYAGYFAGRVNVTGMLTKGGGAFRIDHPLDPANKYLSHSFVESPDMMNIYNGVITTDARGYATVTMPEWFETLNFDFRYQLTIIDDSNSPDFVQAKIVSRIRDNQFTLRTSAPNTVVSWQVTGIRHDPFANANRIQVEAYKSDLERGLYLHPELYGRSAGEGMEQVKARAAALNPPAPPTAQPTKSANQTP